MQVRSYVVGGYHGSSQCCWLVRSFVRSYKVLFIRSPARRPFLVGKQIIIMEVTTTTTTATVAPEEEWYDNTTGRFDRKYVRSYILIWGKSYLVMYHYFCGSCCRLGSRRRCRNHHLRCNNNNTDDDLWSHYNCHYSNSRKLYLLYI